MQNIWYKVVSGKRSFLTNTHAFFYDIRTAARAYVQGKMFYTDDIYRSSRWKIIVATNKSKITITNLFDDKNMKKLRRYTKDQRLIDLLALLKDKNSSSLATASINMNFIDTLPLDFFDNNIASQLGKLIMPIMSRLGVDGFYFILRNVKYYFLPIEQLKLHSPQFPITPLLRLHHKELSIIQDQKPWVVSFDFDGVMHKSVIYNPSNRMFNPTIPITEELSFNTAIMPYMERAKQNGFPIIIVTARPALSLIPILNFLEINGLTNYFTSVVCTNGLPKSSYLKHLKAAEHYDDSIPVLEEIEKNDKNIRLFRVDPGANFRVTNFVKNNPKAMYSYSYADRMLNSIRFA